MVAGVVAGVVHDKILLSMTVCDNDMPRDGGLDYDSLRRLDFLKIDAARFLRETGQFDVCYFHMTGTGLFDRRSLAPRKVDAIEIAAFGNE